MIARNLLISHLVADGLEVARPERDRGVDLIAFIDLDESSRFAACPLQLKAATDRSFSINRKYQKFDRLLLVYAWRSAMPERAETYALTYGEALGVATAMGWTTTSSWRERGSYTTNRPSARLVELLKPYLMKPGHWKSKVRAVADA